MHEDRPTLQQDGQMWVVRLQQGNEAVEYRYPSEAQARYFAAVFALGPPSLPPEHRVRRRPRRQRWTVSESPTH